MIGAVRVTTVTPQMNSHVDQRIQMVDDDNDAYSTNIQIAELNALNAVQAVIKWKKLRGFYHDALEDNHSIYTINTVLVSNEDYIFKYKFVQYIPEKIEDGIIYISIEFNTMSHKCACGCGNEVITPISPGGWSFVYDGKTISINPSIGNFSFPCKSH